MLRWCWAHGYVEQNVAGEEIEGALPAMQAVKEHFRALPFGEVGAALETVETSRASLAGEALPPLSGADGGTIRRSAGRDLGGGGLRGKGMADSR